MSCHTTLSLYTVLFGIASTFPMSSSSSSPALRAEELHNKHDAAGLKAIATPDCKFIVTGDTGTTMAWADYLDTFTSVVAAFPDIHFAWSETNQLDDGTVTSKVVAMGTHTGKPYGFGPFPPIAANGTKCQNDPEYVEWLVEGDKIKEMKVTAPPGSFKTGPAGFYLQIGGKME